MKRLCIIITLLGFILSSRAVLAQAPAGREYVVQAGESLSAIAEREYGDPLAYVVIIEATNAKAAEDSSFAVIDNPSAIEVGQKVWLPSEPDLSDLVPVPVSVPVFAPANFGAAWQGVDCDVFDLPPDVIAQSDCGYVTVPEFHSQPDGPTIQVAVVRTRSFSNNPAPAPLFMEQGGPGGSTIGLYPVILPDYPNMLRLLRNYDLVFVEQRGTLYSEPSMLCPEETISHLAEVMGLIEADNGRYLTLCRDRLLAEGVNLNAFNSVENAADMYTVAETLGYDAFNFYGTSYGTLLAQYVIAQADNHSVSLRSAIIDAVVAPDVNFNAKIGDTTSYALRNLFAACAQDAVCNRDFPDLENVFLSLVDRLNQEPVPITLAVPDLFEDTDEIIETTLDGEDFVGVVFGKLYSTRQSQILPRNIYRTLQENDVSWLVDTLSNNLYPDTSARGMYFTVLCARQGAYVSEGSFFGTPYSQLQFMNNDQDFAQGCDMMGVSPEAAFSLENRSTPTLILNGAYDPATPQPYGEYVGSLLNTAYVFTFPGVGHGVLLDNNCATDIAINFLDNPAQTPDSGCLSQVRPIFYGRLTPLSELTLVATTLINGVTIDLPSQWERLDFGAYVDPNDNGQARTGTVLVRYMSQPSLDEAIASLDESVVEIARDVPIGNYQWTILEDSSAVLFQRYGLAFIPETGRVLSVRFFVHPSTAEEVLATLWEPMLTSVRVSAE